MIDIKGIIFDLDGTLTLTQQFHFMALEHVFREYGITYTTEEDQLKHSGKGSRYTCETVLFENGKNPGPEEIEKCAARKKVLYDEILEKEIVQPVPGILEFLEKVRSAGYKLIIATGNKLDATRKILEKAGIDGQLPDIVAQQDVKNQKPAPDIFLLAAEKIGLKPEECLVFEDAINGVIAAKKAGMYCVAVTTGTPSEELTTAGADATVKDYNEVLANPSIAQLKI